VTGSIIIGSTIIGSIIIFTLLSVNERIHEINESMKLHILEVWQKAH